MAAHRETTPGVALLVDRVSKSFPRRRSASELLTRPFARRERVRALDAASFSVGCGELVGLLGPNGAGKTTLLKILCGLVLPDEGRAEVLGVSVAGPDLPQLVGLAHGDERSFYWRLTARENLEVFGRLHRLSALVRAKKVAGLLERVGLAADADRRFADFSSGMRQRLAIARALLADPPVLLMDEPTRSLDPLTAAEQREWIRDELHRRDRKTILLATHNLREAELLCDTVVVIVKGRVRAVGAPDQLRRLGLGGMVYRLRVRGDAPEVFAGGETLSRVVVEDGVVELVVHIADESRLDPLLQDVRARGGRLVGCAPEASDLEHVFRRLVTDAPAPEAP